MTEKSPKPNPGETFNALWAKAIEQRRENDSMKVAVVVGDVSLLVELSPPASTYTPKPKQIKDTKPRPEKISVETVTAYLVDGGVPDEAMKLLGITEDQSGMAIVVHLNGFLDKNFYKVANLLEGGLGSPKFTKETKEWLIKK